MTSQPLISVVMPAYNAQRFIGNTLYSALRQTYTNLEVIVVDDGSQDQTVPFVRSIASSDHRVKLVQQSNRGVAAARNLAISHSSGDLIAPLDADDLWFPQKIEKQVQCFQQGGPKVGLVYTWRIVIDQSGKFLYRGLKERERGSVFRQLLCRNFIGNASIPLIRRECFEEVGAYNSSLKERGGQGCEDWDLSLRIAERYRLDVVPEFLTVYRHIIGSMSRNAASMEESHKLMIEDLKHRCPEIPRTFYRISRSQFLLHLAKLALEDRRFYGAFHRIFHAFVSHPGTLFTPQTLGGAFKGLFSKRNSPHHDFSKESNVWALPETAGEGMNL